MKDNRKRDKEETAHLKVLKNLFAAFLSFSLILNGYASGIGSVSLGVVLFGVFTIISVFLFFKNPILKKGQNAPILFALYLFVITIFQWQNGNVELSSSSTVSAILKVLLWAFSASILSSHLLDYALLKKWLKRVVVISFIYLLVQYIFYYILHIPLPSVINIGVIRPNYEIYYASQLGVHGYRPSSFFAEPAFLATYMILNLVLAMYDDDYAVNNVRYRIICTLSIILSTSSGGVYMCLLLWSIFFIKKAQKAWKVLAYSLMVLLMLAGGIVYGSVEWSALKNNGTLGKTAYNTITKIQTMDTSGRIGRSYAYISLLDENERYFGIGIGGENKRIIADTNSDNTYTNAITALIFWGGYVGLFIFLLLNIKHFLNSNNRLTKILIITYVIYGLFSGIYFSLSGILFYSIIMNTITIKLKNHEQIKEQ